MEGPSEPIAPYFFLSILLELGSVELFIERYLVQLCMWFWKVIGVI